MKKQKTITFFLCFFLLHLVLSEKNLCALESYKQNYLNGIQYKEKGHYEDAVKEFTRAIKENSQGKKKIRFYGMRYDEYLPHKEIGICYYMLKQYRNALDELELSLSNVMSEETRKYIKLVKVELAKMKSEDIYVEVETPEELKEPRITDKTNHYGVAVIIGNRDYINKDIPPVNYAIQDASIVKKFLIKTFGFREGNIIFRTNATKGVFENIFGSFESHKGMIFDNILPGKSDVFVYYSGHGAPSLETKKGYILPVDGNPNTVSISGYSLEQLYRNLSLLKARSVTVVTDACFSGASIFKKASPVGILVKNPLIALKDTTIMNSSAGTELSSWYSQKGHGLFTYYFLLGITGKADTNNNNQITVKEFTAYIADNVPYMARKLHEGRKQTPVINSYNNDKVFVMYK